MVPVLTRTAGRAAAAFTPDVCLAGSARLAVAPFPAPCRRGGGHSHGALFCRRAPEVTRRRAVDDGDLGASSLDKGFEVMLQQLRDAGNENLRECLEQNTAGLGIDFLTWLAQQQEAARPGSSASQELESLISRILCIREGFEPISTTDALELASGPDESEKEPLEVLAAGYGNGTKPDEQVMRHAQTALTQEGSSKLHEKAEALRSSMLSAKQDSATALMGRRAFPTLEEARGAEQAAAATNVAGRILSVLLTMPSRADRKAALVDAFTPPSNAELFELTAPEEEEMLYTSPFTMLTTVDMELARFKSPLTAKSILGYAECGMDVEDNLTQIREDIVEYLDQHGPPPP